MWLISNDSLYNEFLNDGVQMPPQRKQIIQQLRPYELYKPPCHQVSSHSFFKTVTLSSLNNVKEKCSIGNLNTVLFKSDISDAEVVLFGIILEINDFKKSIDFDNMLENQLCEYIKWI